MKALDFNTGWEIVRTQKAFPFTTTRTPVTLPYDVMLDEPRTPDAPGGSAKGFYPSLACTLEKKFTAPAEWRGQQIALEFEGVYSNSMVYLNHEYIGGCKNGYMNFVLPMDDVLLYGQENTLTVKTRTMQDSRWYSGAGIYRNVNLLLGGECSVTPYGLRVTVKETDEAGALLEVAADLHNAGRYGRTVQVRTTLLDPAGETAAQGCDPVTVFSTAQETLKQRFYLADAKRWGPDAPLLYRVKVEVYDGEELLDGAETTFGIRTLALDPQHGLRINGKPVKLRGACVHHDNGLLGAADIDRAEERRVQLLKAAGFNAVRSAHNPISKAFLNACDREGVLVMDELTDMWTQSKTDEDAATDFTHYADEMIHAMVAKDYNHPSVILYSIGNEIPEVSSKHGAQLSRKLAETFRACDPGRYTINSINLIMAALGKLTMPELIASANQNVNDVMTNLADRIGQIANSDLVTKAVRESLSTTDLIGYNYATERYLDDRRRLPNHVLCGTETYPNKIAENWGIIKQAPHVIGDFTWTGWDYLGEAGVGQQRYREESADGGYQGSYPCFIAYCGDLDITGFRRPASYYREIVFGLRTAPYMAVEYPWRHGLTPMTNKWVFFDGIASWTWPGYEGKEVTVQVYTPGESVCLFCNGEKIAESPVKNFIAEFHIPYTPGTLSAVAMTNGKADGRIDLRTASESCALQMQCDRTALTAGTHDLAYIDLTLTDENGVLQPITGREVTVTVEGEGTLAGFGSANPMGSDTFRTVTAHTFDGHAQAIIRPNGVGTIRVTATVDGLAPQTVELTVTE